MGKARISIFQLSDRVYPIAPPAPTRVLPLTLAYRAYPVVVERIDALLVIENLRVSVRMGFTVHFAPEDADREHVALSEEITVAGDGRAIEAVVHAGPVTLPRPGRYQFDLLANGIRVKAQGVMFSVDRRSLPRLR